MTVKYINRKNKTYYLHTKKTKTGKLKYFFSLNSEGMLADEIPEGYEIYENHNAQVFLRRIQPKIITDTEKALVEKGLKELTDLKYYFVDIKKNAIILFLVDQDIDGLSELFKFAPVKSDKLDIDAFLKKIVTYSPRMKFVLSDKEKRLFITQRYCYLGSVDDWIEIGEPDVLKNLVNKYVRHINKDSYYELF